MEKSYEKKKKELAGRMYGIDGHAKTSFTPKNKKEERLFKKYFQLKTA